MLLNNQKEKKYLSLLSFVPVMLFNLLLFHGQRYFFEKILMLFFNSISFGLKKSFIVFPLIIKTYTGITYIVIVATLFKIFN